MTNIHRQFVSLAIALWLYLQRLHTFRPRFVLGGGGVSDGIGYWSIEKCKKAYSQYIANKSQEIEEQKNARRYYHGVHWTSEQVRELNKRKQLRSSRSIGLRARLMAW